MASRREKGYLQRHSSPEAVESEPLPSVSPVGIFRTDPVGRCLSVNARWCEIAGCVPEEALGEGWAQALHPDDRDRVVEEWNRATHENRSHESRFRFQRPDGAIAWVLGQALPERDIHGKITGFIGTVTDLTQHIEAENGLRASQAKLELRNEQLRRLAIKLGLAQERERSRIARGLHDEVGQLLARARLALGKLMRNGAGGDIAAQARAVDALVHGAIGETRSLTFELSSPVLHELGLGAAVESLCERLSEQSGVQFNVEVKTEANSFTEELRILLYQAVRELCANVVKHARAPRAEVYLHADCDRIWIVVDDDGEGFERSNGKPAFTQDGGFGLFAIREMSSQMGGSFEIESAPGNGTFAVLTVPLS